MPQLLPVSAFRTIIRGRGSIPTEVVWTRALIPVRPSAYEGTIGSWSHSCSFHIVGCSEVRPMAAHLVIYLSLLLGIEWLEIKEHFAEAVL